MVLRNVAVEREAKVPEGYLKIVSQILETGMAEAPQKIVTRNMETVDRDGLKLPKIRHSRESFQAIFMKAMEEK
jgi:hypothetical protein